MARLLQQLVPGRAYAWRFFRGMIGAGAPAQTLGWSHPSHTMRAAGPLDSARRPAHPAPLPFRLLVPVDQIYRWSLAATPLLLDQISRCTVGPSTKKDSSLARRPPVPPALIPRPPHELTPAARPSAGSSSSRHGCNIPEAPPAPPLITIVQVEPPCPRQKHKLH